MARSATAHLHRLCKRYGPGRLPRADDDTIGAGYAGATAAVVGTVAFAVATIGADLLYGGALEGSVLAAVGIVLLPIVGPSAFVAAVVVWQALPEETPYYGVTVGLLGTLLTYVGAFLLGSTLLIGSTVFSSTGTEPVSAAVFALGVADVAFRLTAWLTVPLGCTSGYLYDRVAIRARTAA